MMKLDDIMNKLRQVQLKYPDTRFGVAGSYARGEETAKSDIDIVLDGDSTNVELMDYLEDLFDIKIDMLWIDLLKASDERLDEVLKSEGLPPNEYSTYKSVCKEVIWV